MRRASRTIDSLSRLSGGAYDDRFAAFVALLARPDPPDLKGRGHHYTYARDRRRDPDTIKRDLGTAYVEWCRQDHVDLSCVVSVQRQPRFKVVR